MRPACATAAVGQAARGVGRWRAYAIACATLAAIGALSGMGSAGAAGAPRARAATSVKVKDEGYLRLSRSSGSVLIDEGSAHGTIPGKVRVRFVYDGSPSIEAQITIVGRTGSIQAKGSGRLSDPTSSSPSFKGTLTITGGGGRYAGARGGGQFYGVFYRRSYAITVQTEGLLRY